MNIKNLLYLVILILNQQIIAQTFEKTAQMELYKGFYNFYYEESSDKIFMVVDKLETDFLYVNSLAAGIGSNDIGLDRGKLGKTAVVQFIKAGNKLLLIQPNLDYRAITNNVEEQKSVKEAFAQSVLFGFSIVETVENSFLIDVSKFFIQDTFGVGNYLKRTNQGNYGLDVSKSAFYMERTKAFPKNVEFEAILTFKGEAKGREIRSVSPNSSLITVRQHHSFVELPDDNFEMRAFDTRSGAISFSYLDYATPIASPIEKKFIIKHRLKKKNPNAAISEPIEPIIYYLDRGAPEPIKSSLLEGGRWWNQAFEAAGYKNAFQFKVLPEGADPLDIRYNVVQWVHRSTRGWSYGGAVVDPRTGEILKGHVSLGSLRVRQDYLIAQALLGASDKTGEENPLLQMALARIRQLSAHEIGHTLGFAHNFASSYNNRASVMDYPHPYIQLKNGNIDVSEAYESGIGEWDKVTVNYSYRDFSNKKDEKEALNKILETAIDKDFKFISDADARAKGGAHIYAHLWDNGNNPAKELDRVLNVRKTAIEKFSLNNIHKNEPLTKLEDVFVPLYFFHRYQVEAASKLIGGLDYNYAVKNDDQTIVKPVDSKLEREALKSVLKTISMETLAIPSTILELFPPRAFGYRKSRESFNSSTGVSFDAFSAAATATSLVTQFLFHPERANRMVQQKARFSKNLGFNELLDEVFNNTFFIHHKNEYNNQLQNSINSTVLQSLFELFSANKTTFQVESIILLKLNMLKNKLLETKSDTTYTEGYVYLIDTFLKDPAKFKKEVINRIPDGSPIGNGSCSIGHF